jgi:hypothetical protein
LDPEDIKILGNVVLRRKPQSTFCVLHSDIHIWVPSFLEPEGIRKLNIRGHLNFVKGTGLL